jgi:hypothetical protein
MHDGSRLICRAVLSRRHDQVSSDFDQNRGQDIPSPIAAPWTPLVGAVIIATLIQGGIIFSIFFVACLVCYGVGLMLGTTPWRKQGGGCG